MIRNSLKNKITLTLVTMLIIFLVALLLLVRFISKTAIESYVYNDIYARQQEMYDGFSMVLDEVNLLYSRMVLNDDFETVLQDDSLSVEQRQAMYQNIMNKVGVNQSIFDNVMIYYQDTIYQMNKENLELPTKQFIDTIISSPHLIDQGGVIHGVNGDYLVIGKRMVNFPVGNVTGAAIFYVNENVLSDLLGSISKDLGYSFVISNNNYIIANSKDENLGETVFDTDLFSFHNLPNYKVRTIENQKSIIIVNESKEFNSRYNLDWHIVSVISYGVLFKDILHLNQYILFIGIIMALLAAVTAYRLSNRITKPINNIIIGLRKFSLSGKREAFEHSEVRDELWELEHTYDEMINRIINLIETNQIEMENKRKLELYALQMQINPHFLYNTLDAIAWMAKIKKQKEIEKLVLALARFFRISLHKGDKYITVEEEFELIRNFIDIELIRFPSKFTIDYVIADDVKHEETLKLILQPIVENAIKHGISQVDYQGHIELKAYKDENYLYYEVIDNGIGFNVSEDLFSNNRLSTKGPGGYGLKNVDERIKLEYGRECGLSVSSKTNGGTKVLVKIRLLR